MNETWKTVLIILAIAVVFPLFWSGIIFLISRVSGWAALARQFPAGERISGEVSSYASARLRFFSGYNRCLTITVSAQGIYIRPMLLFRIGHEPIFIPWDQMAELQKKGLSLFPTLDILLNSTGRGHPAKISLYGRRLVETVTRRAPDRLNAIGR